MEDLKFEEKLIEMRFGDKIVLLRGSGVAGVKSVPGPIKKSSSEKGETPEPETKK